MDTSKQLLRVAQITQIDPFVRLYRLKPARQGTCLASFFPGQYLSLFYTIAGSTASRPYSIASSPKEAAGPQGYYELLIHGGGSFTSAWLFKNVEEGDTVEASQPLGDFLKALQRQITTATFNSAAISHVQPRTLRQFPLGKAFFKSQPADGGSEGKEDGVLLHRGRIIGRGRTISP